MSLGGGVGPQMNKFEQVFSDHHQTSLVGVVWVSYHVTYPMIYLMLHTRADRRQWKYYLPQTSFAGGKDIYVHSFFKL